MRLALDHLVIAARTLDEGVAWCEATLGIRPEAGGRHAAMSTHNRIFPIATAAFPRSYAELIAIDPDAARGAARHARWFDLDDARLQRALGAGPQLVHWVARCEGPIDAMRAAFARAGVDVGEIEDAERSTPAGLLRWRISLRRDGVRALDGTVPALIAWPDRHPTDTLPACGVSLQAMRVAGWPAALADALPAAIEADAAEHASPLTVTLLGRLGRVTLPSIRLEG